LRDSLEMTATKFGCGMALCGACTVHLGGKAIRSCVARLSRVAGKHVTTIEGLSSDLSHALQKSLDWAGRSAMRILPVGADPEQTRLRN
jgi:isoquinoline 1-oxidoreductase alpha subunit